MSQLRVAVGGCDRRGRQAYMAHLKSLDDVELVAVCDPVAAARDEAGEEFAVGGGTLTFTGQCRTRQGSLRFLSPHQL